MRQISYIVHIETTKSTKGYVNNNQNLAVKAFFVSCLKRLFSLLFNSSVKMRMQYKITMKYEDVHTKTKVFTDQEIPKKTAKLSCQVRYFLRISYIRHVQFSEAIKD